ncbi:response regulator receiver protein [Stanieria cyanosphaera PCC 7437]|uniref:Response regulator receiver protein n=1 Tax=Stanieria cyanosphaera (strain ATCC 29371 / PCC 7437) TaxID=111780 RepID=K9XZJ4_STAC7|nr:response regulator transcription factor [Stanieria cyanosphaera]AFZ37953.1 response regulator receiver protein [Stanieria cyanosphaera PCC 7437]
MSKAAVKQNVMKVLIVDDHQSVLTGTIGIIQQQYPEAEIWQAQTVENALEKLNSFQPDLAIVDLSLPLKHGDNAEPTKGIELLKTLLTKYPTLNIVVQSADPKTLVRLKPNIYEHEGGFTVVDKSATLQELLTKIDWSLQGLVFTPKEMRNGLEVKEEWLKLLELAFAEGLKDKEIANRMRVAERTVRHYWTKIQDALEVYPEEEKNIRILTGIKAKEEGLID